MQELCRGGDLMKYIEVRCRGQDEVWGGMRCGAGRGVGWDEVRGMGHDICAQNTHLHKLSTP